MAKWGWILFFLENLILAVAFFGPKGIAWFNKSRKKEN